MIMLGKIVLIVIVTLAISEGWAQFNHHRLAIFESDMRARIAKLEIQCGLQRGVREAKQ